RIGARPLLGSHKFRGSRCRRVGNSTHWKSTPHCWIAALALEHLTTFYEGNHMKPHYALLLLAFAVTTATAASTTYTVDPDHTHPSKTSGTVTLDTEAKTGTVDVLVDT